MSRKNIFIAVLILFVIGVYAYWYVSSPKVGQPEIQNAPEQNQNREQTLKTETFSGKLEKVNTACFADGECYVVVDGKHVTAIMGWSKETVGSVIGVEGFGDLETHVGEEVEVYAQSQGGGRYTLYGSANFYIKLKNSTLGKPIDFDFIFRYGIGSKNELNTFNDTYTKDMTVDPSITVALKLTETELAEIKKKINDLRLFDQDEVLKEESMFVTPCSSYYLRVQADSLQKEVRWDNCRGEISDKFRQFTDYMIDIIESKEEYKRLPEPKGGYE